MALSQKIIELLREDPEDLERYRVAADQLQAQGDVRGELIALELARVGLDERTPRWRTLTGAIDRLLEEHSKQLLGALWTATGNLRLVWRLGFIREAALWTFGAPPPPVTTGRAGARAPRARVNKLLKHTDALLSLESSALLEHLTLASTFNAQLFLWDACERVSQGAPPTLHRLDLRDLDGRTLPDWEPERQVELVWRRRVLTLRSDTLSLESAVELFS
ncbi:MAG: hypothetical protein IPJ65_23270 [Archangiaceae bacterium]|nr:hypothetical protein [Archangiaceae bacterium]